MNVVSGLFKYLYWPLCRSYAGQLGNKRADSIFRFLCSVQYWKIYERWPNFAEPHYFTEKVWYRQLHDRSPILTTISDKFRVREHVSKILGKDYLIPLLWDGDKVEEIPFDDLPTKYVIKANHGCGFNIIVTDHPKVNKSEVIRNVEKWMNKNFGADTYLGIAWAYKNIIPHIMVESFIGEKGKAPLDYKFFCYEGRVEFFKVDFDRFENHAAMYFNRELQGLGSIEDGFKEYKVDFKLPDNLEDLFQVAELLAKGFDFMRVDLYSVGGKIYFGELTPYPGGIFQRFTYDKFDYLFGEKWKISH